MKKRIVFLSAFVAAAAICTALYTEKQAKTDLLNISQSTVIEEENIPLSNDALTNDKGSLASHGILIEDESVPLAAEPAVPNVLMPAASGKKTQKNSKAEIDYSNTNDGYVMARYKASTTKKLKVQVARSGGTTYAYDIKPSEEYTTFPISDGDGSYKVTVFENVSGTSYATVLSTSFSVKLKDEFMPFLLPNQYVNYTCNTKCVIKGREITEGITDTLLKVQAIYDYVVDNFSYDYNLAATVKSGYTPNLDNVFEAKKGICFDYASIVTSMLRSQKIPTKLVVGYSGTTYHAWINVYSKETGWVDAAIYFDGSKWQLMDPTFASTGRRSDRVTQYITNSSNYVEKYIY